jgi:hypothetical protein
VPACSAQTQFEVNDASVGFPTVASALGQGLGLGNLVHRAKQVTAARYSAVSF